MKILISTLFLVFFTTLSISAQGHNHNHPDHEIGMVHGIVYIPEYDETAYGLHLHLIHRLEHTKLGFGVGYERVFDEHGHSMFGFVMSYYPIQEWSISFTPGVMFEDEAPSDLRFALHLETLYEFHINDFHIGPTIGAAYTTEHYHLSLGVHFGYAF